MAIKWLLKATLLTCYLFFGSFNGKIRVIVLVNGPELTALKKLMLIQAALFRGIKNDYLR